jgi:hypothetical protein
LLACHLLRIPLTRPKEVMAMCALKCAGRWDSAVDERPCGEAATGGSAITSLDSADNTSDRVSQGDSTDLDNHVDTSGLDGNRRRITSPRTARLARRAAVAASKDVRNALSASGETGVHRRPEPKKGSSRKGPVVISQQKAQPDTPKPKSASALSRSDPSLPTWIPSSCGASGSTCGGSTAGPGSGSALERSPGAEHEGFAPPSPLEIKREAEAHPAAEARPVAADHPPGWVPSSCGFSGGTCGGADGSGGTAAKRVISAEQDGIASSPLLRKAKPKTTPPPLTDPRQLTEHPPGWSPSSCGFSGSTCGGGSSSGPASMPPVQVIKRQAISQPAVDARALDDHPPGWTPMSCTIHGVTCGKSNGVEKGIDSDGTADAKADNGPPAPYND